VQPRTRFGLIGWAASLLVISLAMPMTSSPGTGACRGLQGTFLQLTYAQAARPSDDWRQLTDELQTIGIRNLFLQWTVVDRNAFFPTAGYETPANTPLPYILDLAAQADMQTWIGLATDSRYWEEIKQNPELLRVYFHTRLRDLRGFVKDLNAAISSASFAGWYIPDEIDDRTWLDPGKRAVLKKYLADTVTLLKTIRPGSRVAISGFSNSFADPDQLAAFWADVIKSSGIDLLLFQDGVGEGKVAAEDIGFYYGALNHAVQGAGGQLGAVVELFSLMPNGQRVPAMIARVREQIGAAERLTSFPPVAFSVPDYMSRLAGQQASGLLANFLSAQRGCRS
jgi:Domain of unknown function (DUF4434)